MLFRACALLCVLFTIGETEAAFAKRDVSSQPNNAVVSIQKNLDSFRRCLDQSLATAVGDVNEKHLQPVFSVIGDSLNRVSKAFDDLTATTKKPDPDLDF